MEENKKFEKVERVVEVRQTANPKAGNYVSAVKVESKPASPTVRAIRQAIVWFNIFTAIICAILSLVNIWSNGSLDDIMGKTWATFLILGGFSLLIALIAPLLDKE